jgi:hypothetical protein
VNGFLVAEIMEILLVVFGFPRNEDNSSMRGVRLIKRHLY